MVDYYCGVKQVVEYNSGLQSGDDHNLLGRECRTEALHVNVE